MTNNNWGRDYPPINYGRDYPSPNFGRDLGGTNFGRGAAYGEETAPPLAWYSTRLLATRPASIVGYWRLSEPSGSVAADASGNARHGAYSNVTLGQPGIGDELTAPVFNGTTSYVNLYSAGMAGAFSGAAGTLALWGKIPAWNDGVSRRLASIRVSSAHSVHFAKATNGQFSAIYIANSITSQVIIPITTVDWFHVAITWDKAADEVRAYLNGVQSGATQTGLGVWAGSLSSTSCVIGGTNTTPATPWIGGAAHAGLWNVALTPAEVAPLGRVV